MNCELGETIFENCNLHRSLIAHVNEAVSFIKTDLTDAFLITDDIFNFKECNFKNCKLEIDTDNQIKFDNKIMEKINISREYWKRAELNNCILNESNMKNINLNNASLVNAILIDANLTNAQLKMANFKKFKFEK